MFQICETEEILLWENIMRKTSELEEMICEIDSHSGKSIDVSFCRIADLQSL